MKISILTPTRGRPKFVCQLIKSAIFTAKNSDNLEFIFYMDNDDFRSLYLFDNILDDELEDWCDEAGIPQPTIKTIVGERIILSQMWNECWKIATGEIFVHCGDDLRFRTKNWDEIVINKFLEFPDRIAFVYGDDGYHKSFGTHGILHRNWTNVLGYFVPPYFSSDYNDTWLNDIAKLIGRHCKVDIYTEHLHPAVGKHFYDQTHLDRIERGNEDRVDLLYEEKEPERKECADKLTDFICNFSN